MTGIPADDPFSARRPTSHERRAGQPWDASYRGDPAPWDVGAPQPAIVRLAAEGGFAGSVLDAGCGTGENALHVAALGLRVLGVDVAATAVAIAREKAARRPRPAESTHCGLLHTFDGDERSDYVASLASVTERGAALHVLCFSDVGPDTGPHAVSEQELRAAFDDAGGWRVAAVRPERCETRFHAAGAPAWLATMERT